MNNETNRLAQLIANAADKELGTRVATDGQPRRQDKAAALAIEAEYLFIRRDHLPGVSEGRHAHTYVIGGDDIECYAAAEARGMALSDLALWQHIAAKEDAAREAKQALDKRRDELAAEFTAVDAYNGQLQYTKNLIDRIIELEGKAA